MIAIKFFPSAIVWLAFSLSAAVLPKSITVNQIANRYVTVNTPATVVIANTQFSDITAKVYDTQGKFISNMTISDGPNPMEQTLTWNGKGSNSQNASSGVYVFVIVAEGNSYRGLLVVIR